ncbi:HipA domain-containing protein [Candidatus Saccharibacteria bacterium]|nr:HipA domain-containing protein [Candidatus Saccharibacteria bacterium]
MEKYPFKIPNANFEFVTDDSETKGSRKKRKVIVLDNNIADSSKEAVFKYELYNCTESCSEKIAYEIAKVLGYPCAKIELAKDENQIVGVINYNFIKKRSGEEHTDFGNFFNINSENRKTMYTLEKVHELLDELDVKLYNKFIRIMFFDALIGETDRHEENWGILRTYDDGKVLLEISPLYDNGCSLLREFKNYTFASKYYDGARKLEDYINRGTVILRNAETGKCFKHFELISKLKDENPTTLRKESEKLNLLDNDTINRIVDYIPDELMIEKHKTIVKQYIKLRKERLCEICG